MPAHVRVALESDVAILAALLGAEVFAGILAGRVALKVLVQVLVLLRVPVLRQQTSLADLPHRQHRP